VFCDHLYGFRQHISAGQSSGWNARPSRADNNIFDAHVRWAQFILPHEITSDVKGLAFQRKYLRFNIHHIHRLLPGEILKRLNDTILGFLCRLVLY
jgi:hypothetical protein